jgi:hypothetical protein
VSHAATFISAVWPSMRASKTSGQWPVSRDRDLVRVGAAFADLNARLLSGEAPPGLSDRARNILVADDRGRAYPARTIRGRRTQDHQATRDHARNPPRWPAVRFGSVRRPQSNGATRDRKDVGGIRLRNRRHWVLALTALGAALATPTPEAAKRRHHASWTGRHATPPIYTQEGPTFPSPPVMPVTMQ